MKRKKLIRLTAHSQTLGLLKGQIGYLAKEMDVILVAKDTGNLRALAEVEGVEYRDINMYREINLIGDIKSLVTLIRLFIKERPDIVHANTPKGALLGLLAAKLTRVPHRIYNVNGLRFETTTGLFRRFLILMERIACSCANKVIPQSNGVAELVRREHLTSKPIKVIHNGSGNGVNINHFNPEIPEIRSKATEIRNGWAGISFVFVGRLVGDKGVNELVKAFDLLCNKYADIRLYLIGGREDKLDPLNTETSDIISTNKKIFALGHQSDVRPYLAASDVFVLPSYREGFPNVVLEASAMGLPCIVTDVNGAPDAIKTGENGIIVQKKDTQSLYDAMEELYLNTQLRTKMASAARQMVNARFNCIDVWDATLQMYKNLH